MTSYLWNYGPNSFFLLFQHLPEQEGTNWARDLLLLPWEVVSLENLGWRIILSQNGECWSVFLSYLSGEAQLLVRSAAWNDWSRQRCCQEGAWSSPWTTQMCHDPSPEGWTGMLCMSRLGKMSRKLQWELLGLVFYFCASKSPRNPSLSHEGEEVALSQAKPYPTPFLLSLLDKWRWKCLILNFFFFDWRVYDFKTGCWWIFLPDVLLGETPAWVSDGTNVPELMELLSHPSFQAVFSLPSDR